MGQNGPIPWVVSMKGNMKALAIIVCALFVISPFSAMLGGAQTGSRAVTVPKIVVGELFTGLWCGYCKYAEQAMDKLMDDNTVFDDRFVLVEWHNGDKYAIPEGAGREAYYSVTGFPTARFDGIDSSVGAGSEAAAEQAYRAKIDGRSKNADAFVEIDAHITGTQLTVWVNVTLTADISLTNLKVRAVTIQDEDIVDGGGLYPIRMTAVNYTIPGTVTTISKKGDVARVTNTVNVNPAWDVSKLRVVAWLQSDTNKEVVQGNINYITANGGFSKTNDIVDPVIDEDTVYTKDLKSVYTDPENDPVGAYTLTATTVKGTIDGKSLLTLTPPADWSGQDNIYIVMSDGMNFPIEFSFKITVNPVNDPPLRNKFLPNVTMVEGTAKLDNFNLNDYFSDVDNPTLTYSFTGAQHVNVSIKASGLVSFSAPVLFSGQETLTFTAKDAGGLTASGDMWVKVTDVNFPPKQSKPIPDITMNEDQVDKSIKLTDYFSDIDSPVLNYTLTGLYYIQATIGKDMVITITPKADWNGVETAVMTVTDTVNKAITDSFTITVNAVNDPPTLTGKAFEAARFNESMDLTTEMAVSALFADIDGPTLVFSVDQGDSDLGIALNNDLTVTFHPAAHWNGVRQYWIKATDNQYTVQYNATVTVLAVNDPPHIDSFAPTSPTATINENDWVDFNIVATDVANEKETLVYKWTSNNKEIGEDGPDYKFATDFNSSGKYIIKVTVSDGELTDSHTWTLTVKNMNRKPTVQITAPGATDTFRSDTPVTFTAVGSDPDGEKVSYQWSVDGISIGSSATVTAPVAAGTHTVKVVAFDGTGASAEQTMSITVKEIKKGSGNSDNGSNLMLFAVLGAIVAAIVVVALALMIRRRKAKPAEPMGQVAPPPPPSPYPQETTAPAYDPYAGYNQPPAQTYYDPNAPYYPPPPQ